MRCERRIELRCVDAEKNANERRGLPELARRFAGAIVRRRAAAIDERHAVRCLAWLADEDLRAREKAGALAR